MQEQLEALTAQKDGAQHRPLREADLPVDRWQSAQVQRAKPGYSQQNARRQRRQGFGFGGR